MLPPRFILQRHGETSWDSTNPVKNRINGWSSEGLDSGGVSQVTAQLPTLKDAGITGILHSDLARARETATLDQEALDVPAVDEYGLRCWFLGMYAGQLEPVVKPLVQFFVDHPDTPVPHGESFHTYIGRLYQTVEKVERYAIRHPDKCLLLVTHGSCIEYLIHRLEGVTPGQKQLSGFPPAGLYDVFYLAGKWQGRMHKGE